MACRRIARWARRSAALLGVFLLACGGAAPEPFPPSPPEPPVEWPPYGQGAYLSGTLQLPENASAQSGVLEAEPNDSADTAHWLGDLRPGTTLVVHGHTTARDDSDPFDGFALRAPQRVRVTATLAFPDESGNDFDMGVYDPTTLQWVETYLAATAPEVGTFDVKGPFDLAVQAYAGEGDYVLTIAAVACADPIPEEEPNDGPGAAAFLGEAAPGDVIRVRGTAGAAGDDTDGFVVVCPEATRLSVALGFPTGADFDVAVSDATEDLLLPAPLAAFDSADENPESGSLEVAGGTLLYVEVLAYRGSGTWTLDLAAAAPASSAAKTRLEQRGRIAPLASEAGRLRRGGDLRYGRLATAFVPGEALVTLADDGGSSAAAKRGARVLSDGAGGVLRLDVELPAGLADEDRARATLSRIAALRGAAGIRHAEPNYRRFALATPDDESYNLQWHYPLIHLPEAWELTTGSASVVVAVIDTGRTNHPDLAGRQSGGYDFISDASNAGDGNGMDGDPTDVGDRLGSSGQSSFHGTHVAGTIGAATNNGTGVAGVTWQGTLMHLRVLGRQGGSDYDIAQAIRYAARLSNASGNLPARRADVINMSLGGPGYSQTLRDACVAARNGGVVVVAAAGNEASSSPSYPAAYEGVVSVSAVDSRRSLAPYSNTGSTIDLAAPGGDTSVDRNGDGYEDGVLSTLYDDSYNPPRAVYAFYQGTSMAAPHVVGVVALVRGANPALTPAQVEDLLFSTAEDLGTSGRDNRFGHGLVNAYEAVKAALGASSDTPVLVLSPASLSFGSSLDRLDVEVRNAGGGYLDLQGIETTTQDGGDWLAAEAFGSGDSSREADGLRVEVRRDGLAAGSRSGRVTVTSSGGTRDVQVLMVVGGGGGTLPDVDLYVLALDAWTGETIAEVVVNTTRGLDYAFEGLPSGTYTVAAGSDLDDDGYICDEGEWCGEWPVRGEPEPIFLVDGDERTGIDFVVERGVAFAASAKVASTAEAAPRCGIRRRR